MRAGPTTWMASLLVVAALATVLGAVVLTSRPDPGAPAPIPDTLAGPTHEPASPSPLPTPSAGPQEETLVMWAHGGLQPDVATRIAALPEVTAVAFVRSATLGLVASRDADGSSVEQLADGYRLPVAVAAVDPADLAATSPDAPAVLRDLQAGEVLLSETSARLRGIGAGGGIDLASAPGLVVAGVVPDGTARRAELILHAADAARAGIDEDGSVVVRYRTEAAGGAGARAVEAAVRGLLPTEPPIRVVHATDTYRAPLVLPLLEVKERFGELAYRPRPGVREIDADPGFVREHIVDADVPLLGRVRCHRDIIDDLRGALEDVVAGGHGDAIDPAKYGGCFHPRLITADRDGLSRHSWGIAIDINVDLSLPGLGPPPPPEVIDIFERHGFRWGGDFLHPDNHHFEWVGEAVD